METLVQCLEKTLNDLLPEKSGPIFDAARYSLQGGKRLRPRLLLAVLETFHQETEKGLYPAAALEIIHTYSLIHDDLPCMDNDDIRRGRPTLHKVYPESHAVLTGDFLLTYAFEILSTAPLISSEQKIKLIQCASLRCGEKGMIGGQWLDLEGIKSESQMKKMQLKKTGALICAALEFGAVLSEQNSDLLLEIGTDLGIAFQMIDDYIDGDGMTEFISKVKVKEKALKRYETALSKISSLPGGAPQLKKIASEMIFRTI